jgi:hypothetical protein
MELLLSEFATPLCQHSVENRILAWCTKTSASTPPDAKKQLNAMHVLGMKLCSDMHAVEVPGYNEYHLHNEIGSTVAMPFDEPLLSRLDWQQLVDLMGTLQLEYKKIVVWDDTLGFNTPFDIFLLLTCVLKRMGFWVRQAWRPVPGADHPQVLDGTFNVDAQGWHTLSAPALVHMFDVVHVFLALTQRLLSATVLHNTEAHTLVSLHPHLHEASLDDFYLNSIVADCPVGSITQYAHRFQFLFHSVTQVVYFHWPSYRRSIQVPLEEVRKSGASPQHLLPLLLQINPLLGVLHEHTGALLANPDRAWAWMNVAGFFALLGPQDQVFVASDLRVLLLHHQSLTLPAGT